MSGGVDSSVAAALLVEAGHEVVGATMKLWGGASDSGCCSVADVDDARRVAQQLGIAHHVFNFSEDFNERVVAPYVSAHAGGGTPNPCVECNRHLKFDRLLGRAMALGFEALATGHHARVEEGPAGQWSLRRGLDAAKDQSYVVSMLGQAQLARCVFPVGDLRKPEVRARAAALGLRTAGKADSQDVCFITSGGGRSGDGVVVRDIPGGRRAFLADRMALHPGQTVDLDGRVVGEVPAVELVTVGQRRGLGGGGTGARRFALSVDVVTGTVVVGDESDLLTKRSGLSRLTWVGEPVAVGDTVLAQTTAHGPAGEAVFDGAALCWSEPRRRVAPGQTVALYDQDRVLGSAVATFIRRAITR